MNKNISDTHIILKNIDIADIFSLFKAHRLSLTSEKVLQSEIADLLASKNIPFEREVSLSPGDCIDFLVGDIGIEVKLKGSAKAIYRQCARYCQSDRIREILLVTNRAMGLPREINAKPAYLLSLGVSWL